METATDQAATTVANCWPSTLRWIKSFLPRTRLAWPEGEIGDEDIHIASYPFENASLFPGNITIPASRITALFFTDAAFVLDGKEIIFLPEDCGTDLKEFAVRNNIPAPAISDIWDFISEPFLDIRWDGDEKLALRIYAEQGYSSKELLALRKKIARAMKIHTYFTWEWCGYTTQDVLRATARHTPRSFTQKFYWQVMEVALRQYSKVNPDASRLLASLKPYWEDAWLELQLSPPKGLYAEVAGAYLDPNRFYHTLRHLESCFELFGSVRHLCTYPAEVLIALWFHDQFIGQGHEEASAFIAEQKLQEAGAPPEVVNRISELILATQHETMPVTADADIMVDIDLSILAADTATFDEYEVQVRKEYSYISNMVFREERSKVLNRFLTRPSIYSTPYFKNRFEARARTNTARSLAHLSQ